MMRVDKSLGMELGHAENPINPILAIIMIFKL
jgi:hypothetical protein